MCRFVAYLGEPLYLEELIAKPRHSLMRQSLRADQAKTVTNGDGFGIGWYGERPEPAVYREVMPAWAWRYGGWLGRPRADGRPG